MKFSLCKLKVMQQLMSDTFSGCINNDIFYHGAALSYYTFFAIAPLKKSSAS
jgi:uncharacterized BrkB/YihY/UPF0761 family membrane protein